MDGPEKLSPVTSKFDNAGVNFNYTFPASSLSVLRIKTHSIIIRAAENGAGRF
jgi:hypothetical protein